MAGLWDTWLRELRAAGKGGIELPQLGIDRGLDYERIIAFEADFAGDVFTASLRQSPDAVDPTTEDFTVAVGAYADGVTLVTLTLTDAQTAALPSDEDADGATYLVFDILRNGARLFGGLVPVVGKVTNG